MAENNTSIKKIDVEQLIKDGKIYATKADAESGKSANVNSQYFDEDNWEFDSDGRIIEIQQDGSKVVMGWANKEDLANTGSQSKTVTDDFGRQRPSDQVTYHQYDNNQSKTITDDFGRTRTLNSNDTYNNNSNSSGYLETMTTVGVTAGSGSVGRTDQAMTPINTNTSNVDSSKLAQEYYGTPGTTNPHKETTSTNTSSNQSNTSGYKDTMTTAGVTAGSGSVGRTDQAMTPINTNTSNVDSSKLAQEYYGTPGTTNPHKETMTMNTVSYNNTPSSSNNSTSSNSASTSSNSVSNNAVSNNSVSNNAVPNNFVSNNGAANNTTSNPAPQQSNNNTDWGSPSDWKPGANGEPTYNGQTVPKDVAEQYKK